MTVSPRRAFVLGGGVAGLTAALGLRERGLQVTLLESHGWLGGRAFSFVDKATGERLDNGPHAMLGCYGAMRRLLRALGTEGQFARGRSLTVAYRTAAGRASRLRLWPLPVPVAMPWALAAVPLGSGGKLRAVRGLLGVLQGAPADETVASWLARRGQLGTPDAFFWRPLCRAIMNVEPAEASAQLFLATLREAFTGSAAGGAFWLPQRPWGEIVGDAAERELPRRGIDVRLHARVEGLEVVGDRVVRIALADGGLPVGADDVVVSAMPWQALGRLLGEPPFASLSSSPIVSIWFRFAAPVAAVPDEGPMVALVDGDPFHFLFRRPGAPLTDFWLLAGGNRAFDGMRVDAIEQAARVQLARHYPGFATGVAAQVRVAKEARATFVPSPAALRLRPPPGRLVGGPANLLVAGDWTACGLPSTLEGAARSGEAVVGRVGAR
ncbi:MAG: FAD-dependent oxidoreductase [Planctomycetes bacterium]|nr:FAD-dependent oxidoreductase [Planctomycetota bacterium]